MSSESWIEGIASIAVLVVFVIICAVSSIPFNIETRGSGEHTGYVTALENDKGVFVNKTYTTVYFKTDLASSQEDTYCVDDEQEELLKELREASKNKSSVIIKYKGLSFTGIGNCEGDKITNVEIIK